MTCREFIDFLDDYLAGALDIARRDVFDHHLSMCRDCRNYIEQYRQTVALGKAAFDSPDHEVPANVPEALVAAILAASKRRG